MTETDSDVSTPERRASAVINHKGPAFSYFEGDDYQKARGRFQILDEQGRCDPADVIRFDKALTSRLYRDMLLCRIIDQRFMALQRQGVIGFYAEIRGQEASTIGSAAALEPQDWLVPALREHGGGLSRGMDFSAFVAQLFGNAEDVTLGRQMPLHPTDRDTRYVNMSSCVGSQIPHAVGIAMGIKISGTTGEICVGYMGDGATSEADFHVAMNFAGVMCAPCVLICQNNQWAISTPGSAQTAAESIALKGIGYGVEAIRADGNDVFAVYEATRYAADKARRGDGPTFIELLTYRVSAHTSSDDASRYRDESVTELWRTERDPLRRLRIFMEERGWLSEGQHEAMTAEIEATTREMVARHRDLPGPPIESMIEGVYERSWWRLREELAELRAATGETPRRQ